MNGHSVSRRQFGFVCGATVISALVGLPACDDKKKQGVESVRIRQEWFPFSGYAGEMLASRKYASELNLQMQIDAGSSMIDPIKTVLSGEDEVGVVSGDILITAIANNKAPIVAIGVINDLSPTCFIVRKDSGIRSPRDFVGKRVGILRGTNTEKIYELMMKKAGIDRSLIKEVDVPFELQTFVLGQYDVRPAFIYDEPVTLSQQRIDYDILEPQKYGVSFIGTVYFTTRDIVATRRDSIVKTLQALVSGWSDVGKESGQNEAIRSLKEAYPEIDQVRELESLRRGLHLLLGPGDSKRPLTVTPERWSDTIQGLEELGAIQNGSVDSGMVWDESLLRIAYTNNARSKA